MKQRLSAMHLALAAVALAQATQRAVPAQPVVIRARPEPDVRVLCAPRMLDEPWRTRNRHTNRRARR